jgi:deoxyribose-phosphate aldolase
MSDSIAQYIDHAVLHPTQTNADLRAACEICSQYETASICVKPYMVMLAAEYLSDSSVKVSTVISFPHGGCETAVKAVEARHACLDGAVELDMVVNIGQVLEGSWTDVEADIGAVVAVASEHDAIVKVIFETGLLKTERQKIQLCECSERAGAAFVKTSTGFGFVKESNGGLQSTGATFEDIELMRASCSEKVGVKASGGIRTLADARRFIELGATRLGTSGTKSLVDEERGQQQSQQQSQQQQSGERTDY